MLDLIQPIVDATERVHTLRSELTAAERELEDLRKGVPVDVRVKLRSMFGERYRVPPGESERAILDMLEQRGPMKVSELAKALMTAKMTIHVAANRLVTKGKLKRVYDGNAQVFSLA